VTNRRRLRFFLPLPVLAVAALVWPLSRPEAAKPPHRSIGEIAYQSLDDKPDGDLQPGRAGVEQSAIALANWLHAIPATPGSETPCDAANLYVGWTEPTGEIPHGSWSGDLGPAPTADTVAVNGIVWCKGSETYAFMGFKARYADERWDVVAVPDAGDEGDLPEVTTPEPTPANTTPVPSVALDGRVFSAQIEGLAAYEPQRTCDSTAKPGTTALRNLLLRDNAGSRNLGIVRGCSIGGTSEHKEGRAFDWGVNVGNAKEKAEANAFIAKLLATDQFGNTFALARRMGVMYVIWNRQIWSAYRAAEGWRPYHGASAHTDHVHISLSWAGANARTSFWSGKVVQVLLASAPTGAGSGGSTARAATTRRRVAPVSTQQAAADRAKRAAARAAAREAWKKEHEAELADAKATWEAEKAARDAKRAEQRAAWEAKREADKEARDAARKAAAEKYAQEKAERDAARRAAAKAAAKQAAEEREAREQAYAERKAAERAAREAAADKYAQEKAARDAARQAAAEKWAAERTAREQARREAAERAAAEREARRQATTTTTAPAPAPTTTAPGADASPDAGA
jgi:hypothetical protein